MRLVNDNSLVNLYATSFMQGRTKAERIPQRLREDVFKVILWRELWHGPVPLHTETKPNSTT